VVGTIAIGGGLCIALKEDKAEPKYQECVKYESAGDLIAAWAACQEAIKADSTSTHGKAAAERLIALKPKYDIAMAQRARQQEAARQAELARSQEAERAKAARLAQLKERITRKYWDTEPDGVCTGKGMPPYKYDYTGGTFAENREVAYSEGCQSPYTSNDSTTFCCPKRPRTGFF